MIITLIGLSGSGKSFWARRFAQELGYKRICCDDLIEDKLREDLESAGINGIRGVAYWMGQPYEPSFAEHQALYLQHEEQTLIEIAEYLKTKNREKDDLIIDTTGSFIYINEAVCNTLRERSTVVYLQVPEVDQDHMFRQYLTDPKPVVWGDAFNVAPGEDHLHALARCYPELVRSRCRRYEDYADLTLSVSFRNRGELPIGSFLKQVEDAVRK